MLPDLPILYEIFSGRENYKEWTEARAVYYASFFKLMRSR
jgi:hypothetical protein